jgi:hypothetical protein
MAEDLNELNDKELSIYYAGKSSAYWKAQKKRGIENLKYKKKLYKDAVNKTKETDQMPIFLDLLNSKFQKLLKSYNHNL